MCKETFEPLQLSNKVQSIPEALSVYMNNVVYEMKRRLSEGGDEGNKDNKINQTKQRDEGNSRDRKCEENKSNNKIYVLSLGEAYFDIPMFPFEKIDFRKGYHYSESRGLYDLRQIIAEYYEKYYSAPINPDTELIISAGSKPLIYMAFQSVLNPGDEVLIHEPAWLSYPEQIKLADGVPQFIPYDCPVEQFEKYFTNRTKMLVVCNPNNPAGKMYTKEKLEYLYSICRPRGIYILVDEAYSYFVPQISSLNNTVYQTTFTSSVLEMWAA